MNEWEELGFSEPTDREIVRQPNKASQHKLECIRWHLGSIPYKPSVRWLFYRLWQEEGIFKRKPEQADNGKASAYSAFVMGLARWRHTGLLPVDAFVDETSSEIGDFTCKTPLVALADSIEEVTYMTDPWPSQECYVVVAFEAAAMAGQFQHFTEPYHVRLFPFGGTPSISFKYYIACRFNHIWKTHGKPIVLLYFGDCDAHGENIGETASRHIRKWIGGFEFHAYWVGLSLEQANQYGIDPIIIHDPETGEKVLKYQWEGLSHEDGGELITNALDKFCCPRNIKSDQEAFDSELDEIKAKIGDFLEEAS